MILQVKRIFEQEFQCVSDKFVIIEENVADLSSSTKEFIYHPGVYVFIVSNKIIKVGRHLTNSRKRALEHIHANTRNETFEMKYLPDTPNSKVLLFNVLNPDHYHWVAALEIFLERELNPVIKSKRY
ncbi:hypothetical protein LS482_11020 [Sinomicrobium kalidii]|uniref:hypothetical protein n=1 Tax=Sinomicrobium kalidii TaxID=2900738 RepID=UPI001E39E90C|nr:hypothetical protein [Sinomicrobium kalidii]UGU14244.1 hypothetical protein LS482_11020 [Sinomicrobium kalidii]